MSNTEKLPQNKIRKVQEVVDKSDNSHVDNSDFALDEDPVKDEFKGIESKIVAFDKLEDPFQGSEKEQPVDNKQLTSRMTIVSSSKELKWTLLG